MTCQGEMFSRRLFLLLFGIGVYTHLLSWPKYLARLLEIMNRNLTSSTSNSSPSGTVEDAASAQLELPAKWRPFLGHNLGRSLPM